MLIVTYFSDCEVWMVRPVFCIIYSSWFEQIDGSADKWSLVRTKKQKKLWYIISIHLSLSCMLVLYYAVYLNREMGKVWRCHRLSFLSFPSSSNHYISTFTANNSIIDHFIFVIVLLQAPLFTSERISSSFPCTRDVYGKELNLQPHPQLTIRANRIMPWNYTS